MTDILKSIFNPDKQAISASGSLGGLFGAQGRSFGHLGEDYGDLSAYSVEFKANDYFDMTNHFDVMKHFDPSKLLKRY